MCSDTFVNLLGKAMIFPHLPGFESRIFQLVKAKLRENLKREKENCVLVRRNLHYVAPSFQINSVLKY